MRLTDVRIDDFGCFRGARLDGLAEGLVVVGGPQRAGKTTFMRALRQFRGGVGRGGDVPPATDEHRIDAEIAHGGHRYRYVLNGHASPSISPIGDGPEIGVDDVFGPVTERQYRQLYTISLDELRRLPPGIDDAEDLAQVLLGGAYGDIAEIPDLQETFGQRAHDVGLSTGDPTNTTSDLNGPYQTIQNGMEARREASEQVDEHDEVTRELAEKRSERAEIERRIDAERRTRSRLEILGEVFESVQRIDALDAELAGADVAAARDFPTHLTDRLEHFEERFDDAVGDLADAERAFEREIDLTATDAYRDWLLENEGALTRLEGERKLWASDVDDLARRERTLAERRTELESEIAALHPDWDGSFGHVERIATSSVDADRVAELASTVSDLREKRDETSGELDSLRTRREELETQRAALAASQETKMDVAVPKRKPLLVAAAAVAVGAGTGVVTGPLTGGVVGLVVVALGIYAVDSTITVEPTIDTEPRRELRARVSTLDADVRAAEEELEAVDATLETRERELERLATELGLPDDLPSSRIPAFYERVVDLDEAIESYRRDRERWRDGRAKLAADLAEVAELLADLGERSWSADAPLENASSLLATLETATTDLQLAKELREASAVRADCVEDVDSVLTAWSDDRSVDASTSDETIRRHVRAFHERAQRAEAVVRKADRRDRLAEQVANRLDNRSAREVFVPLRDDDEPWIDVVETAADEFADAEAIEDESRDVRDEIDDLEARSERLHERCLELERRRDELASEDDLREAQDRIDEGRVAFERVGEAYAVNRIAEEMVSRLHERLMKDVVHSLVDEASAIFSDITQEYDGIELGGELQDIEFRALRSAGPDHGVGELSRATAEQLFLAVRLARIRQTEVELPVVLDDAATNFDPDHASRVFEVVGELSTTNQVFVLTCHPELVNLTAASEPSAQYWSLEDGAFTRANDATELERRLAAERVLEARS